MWGALLFAQNSIAKLASNKCLPQTRASLYNIPGMMTIASETLCEDFTVGVGLSPISQQPRGKQETTRLGVSHSHLETGKHIGLPDSRRDLGVLPEFQLIPMLQRAVPQEEMSASEGGLYGVTILLSSLSSPVFTFDKSY